MKKIALAILLLSPVCVHAAGKCVKLDPTAVCEVSDDFEDYVVDWEATCPSSNGIPVRGTGMCADTKGTFSSSTVSAVDDLAISDDETDNVYCWCRIISPAVSQWVFLRVLSANTCTWSCVDFCGGAIQSSGADYKLFRQKLFSSLKD